MFPEMTEEDPGLLACWKDIAKYLGKGVRTVQRWEQEFGLPVRRPNGMDHKSAVIAYTRELDAWLDSRWSKRPIESHAVNKHDDHLETVSDLVRSAQVLRSAHMSLLRETRAAVAALVSSCNQFAEQAEFLPTPPRWTFTSPLSEDKLSVPPRC